VVVSYSEEQPQKQKGGKKKVTNTNGPERSKFSFDANVYVHANVYAHGNV
jgi:hypothetical protein